MRGDRGKLAIIVVTALAIRVVLLLLRGDYIVFDEGYYLLLARSLREHQTFALNGLPHVALSPLQPLLVALLSLAGIPDLWVSRLLGALCGSLVAVPVWSLARRIGGPGSADAAAWFSVMASSTMSFLPFFPGEGWNLYFGSEPLFMLLALSACSVAARAVEEPRPLLFAAAGAFAGGAFLTRGEGVILAPLVMLVLLVFCLRRQPRLIKSWLLAVVVAALVSAPYLLYLRTTLGRWAFSGRVQAASSESAAPAPTTRESTQRGGSVLEDFVWGGDQQRFRAELYGLTPDGRRMQSQYWGVDRSEAGPALAPPAPDTSRAAPAPPARRQTFLGMLLSALVVVAPAWLLVLGGLGVLVPVNAWQRLWLLPLIVAALLPAFAAYVEPRSLLPLVPVLSIGAGVGVAWLRQHIQKGRLAVRLPAVTIALLSAMLAAPIARAAWRSRMLDTPLQQLAAAQATVGNYLGLHIDSDATVMSWHPAIALYAERDWRVMPLASIDPLLRYAKSHATILVSSRFYPTPLPQPPQPFFALLLVDSLPANTSTLNIEQVDLTALLLVGRLRPSP